MSKGEHTVDVMQQMEATNEDIEREWRHVLFARRADRCLREFQHLILVEKKKIPKSRAASTLDWLDRQIPKYTRVLHSLSAIVRHRDCLVPIMVEEFHQAQNWYLECLGFLIMIRDQLLDYPEVQQRELERRQRRNEEQMNTPMSPEY